jgi:hypothetical protein
MSVAAIRPFLDLIDIPPRELSGIIEASRAMKKRVRGRDRPRGRKVRGKSKP